MLEAHGLEAPEISEIASEEGGETSFAIMKRSRDRLTKMNTDGCFRPLLHVAGNTIVLAQLGINSVR